MSALIAIVGRPNVGKSALFNRIAGRRIAIVHDQPGVTRDRISAEVESRGQRFTLVDTGGIGLLRREKATDVIAQAALAQVQLALDEAAVIILVVNVQEGVVPLDREVAERLRLAGKPVLVAVNKVDNTRAESGADEFAQLGFERIFPVTAIHGTGIEALVHAALQHLPPPTETAAARTLAPPLKLAIIGRPNVGKSSLINALTQSERVIVSPVPGTTRDAVDVPFEVTTDGRRESFLLIDTAGVRKYRRIADSIEFFSVNRTEEAVARCDIVVLVLDAESGITEQDKKLGDLIVENRRACVVVVNKWDLVAEPIQRAREEEIGRRERKENRAAPKVMTTLGEFGQWVQEHLFFLDYAPVIFTSAQSGFHLERLLEAVRYIAAQLQQKIPTSILNRALHDAVELRQPVSSAGHRLKLFYATQTRQAPPTFLLFVNRVDLFSDPYKKYLANALRKGFGYEGCPIVLVPKERPKVVLEKRKTPRSSRGERPRAGRRRR